MEEPVGTTVALARREGIETSPSFSSKALASSLSSVFCRILLPIASAGMIAVIAMGAGCASDPVGGPRRPARAGDDVSSWGGWDGGRATERSQSSDASGRTDSGPIAGHSVREWNSVRSARSERRPECTSVRDELSLASLGRYASGPFVPDRDAARQYRCPPWEGAHSPPDGARGVRVRSRGCDQHRAGGLPMPPPDAVGEGMALFIRPELEVLRDSIRTFRRFLWSQMPRAARSQDRVTGALWHTDDGWWTLRLSSQNRDVLVQTPGDGAARARESSDGTGARRSGPAERSAQSRRDSLLGRLSRRCCLCWKRL